jgi:hypothetical protein
MGLTTCKVGKYQILDHNGNGLSSLMFFTVTQRANRDLTLALSKRHAAIIALAFQLRHHENVSILIAAIA